ncbi:MAG: metal ABC transporter ATP-binding protein [Patescibacteria group bacterium]
METDAKILTVKNLSVAFDDKNVIENISFDLDGGGDLAIIGPNGSGKTVLIRALLGMVPHGGEIRWMPGLRIGYVPQKIEADRHLPLSLKNLLQAKANVLNLKNTAIRWSMEEVGLGRDAENVPIGHLSGGQFQRALIAFALLDRPNVLILDEPTASIDQPGEEKIYEMVHRLQDKNDMTIILVSHDLSFVYRYATNVLCINRSTICFGPPEDVLDKKILEQIYGPHKYFHHFHHKDDS